jgi:hypothetical protein
VHSLLTKALKELAYDPMKPLERSNIIALAHHLGLSMTAYQALEALLFSRQASRDENKYQMELLVKWFCKNIPVMGVREARDSRNAQGTMTKFGSFASIGLSTRYP